MIRWVHRRLRAIAVVAVVLLLPAIAVLAGSSNAKAAVRNFIDIGVTGDGQGYGLISDAGEVYAYGSVQYRGNPAGFSGGIVGISVTADGQGYAAISGTGQVYAYGSVQYRGNPAGFTGGIVGISVTADGQGYAAISSAGQVYAYGSVRYWGNPAGFTGGIVGISVTADGQGYGALSSYGQVYVYGSVRYWGNGDPGSTSLSDVRSRIVSTAHAETSNASHNKENPLGSNCNFYTTALGAGTVSSICANNWRKQAWCADFARWTWGQAGAVTSGLSGGAISFKTYGVNRGTWHSGSALSGVQPGDVIGYNFTTSDPGDDHVGVVVGINSDGTVNTIDGNYSNGVTPRKITRGPAAISGYTSPVA